MTHAERKLSKLVACAVGFTGTEGGDASKPDGTMRKLIDVSKRYSLGRIHKVEIEGGVQKLFDRFQESLKWERMFWPYILAL